MTNLTLTILGCGSSAGVPSIGNHWGNCDPSNPRNRRTRTGIIVSSPTTTILVDTNPDLTHQLTRENIGGIDAVLYTHAHNDHITGIDDLRLLAMRHNKKIPLYFDQKTCEELHHRFDFIFKQTSIYYPSMVKSNIIDDAQMNKPQLIGDIEFIPFVQEHGMGQKSLGFRFGDTAYSTDMVDLGEDALRVLKGCKTWIADCGDYSKGAGVLHSNLPNIMRLNAIIGAKQVYLSHLKEVDDYMVMSSELPDGYAPAYDGLKINIDIR